MARMWYLGKKYMRHARRNLPNESHLSSNMLKTIMYAEAGNYSDISEKAGQKIVGSAMCALLINKKNKAIHNKKSGKRYLICWLTEKDT